MKSHLASKMEPLVCRFDGWILSRQ